MTKLRLLSTAVFLILSMLAVIFWMYEMGLAVKNHLRAQINFYRSSVNNTIHAINDLTDLIFYLNIDRDRVLRETLKSVNRDNLEELHWRIYRRYKDTYENLMKGKHIRQLHFHLPGGISFLRMHKPDKFGDSLKGVRYSIDLVNRTHKPVKCFEEGRIFNGFRNVYPILEGNKLLGTVEISYDADSVEEILQKEGKPIDVELWIKREVVDRKVWEEERRNYMSLPFAPQFLVDVETHDLNNLSEEDYEIFQKVMQENPIPLKGEEEAIYFDNRVAVFLPLKNCRGEFVAYMVVFSQDPSIYHIHRSFNTYLALTLLLNSVISLLVYKLMMKYKLLRDLSLKDALTGVFNRRAFYDIAPRIINLSKRDNKPVSLIMCDIDNFKKINDLHGHQKGDIVLKEVARTLEKNLRRGDIVARYGGEEFVALVQGDLESAKAVAEKLRKRIEELKPAGIRVTCSFGVAQLKDREDLQTLISRSDKALYKAKDLGKNRVEAL